MPELRGVQATTEIKQMWREAYTIYQHAQGDPLDRKRDRTERITAVARALGVTRKVAKRRIRNYEAWQRNIKAGKVRP